MRYNHAQSARENFVTTLTSLDLVGINDTVRPLLQEFLNEEMSGKSIRADFVAAYS